MTENPSELTQKPSEDSQNTNPTAQNANGIHPGRTASPLDPQAPNFVPGHTASTAHAQSNSRPANRRNISGPSSTQTSQQSNGIHKGQDRGEGGLSRALRRNSRADRQEVAHDGRHAANPPANVANGDLGPAAASAVEAAPPGSSPSSRPYVSANHLLNFRINSPAQQGRGGRHGLRGPTQGRQPAYDRNQFLQANFRFLVSDAADLRTHAANADLMPDWEDVVEVELPVTAEVQCPISLETPPPCPQITPCGHVFGFSAIMAHLVSHGGTGLRKASPCPLCFAPVAARELRLLRFQHVIPPEVGGEVAFQLLQRGRTAFIPTKSGSGQVEKTPAQIGIWPHLSAEGSTQLSKGNKTWDASNVEYERHSKFTLVSDPLPLWCNAVEQLSRAAVQVTAEGGQDAELEAPAIYGAMDAMEARASAWVERRNRILMQRSGSDSASLPGPETVVLTAVATLRRARDQAAEAAIHERQQASSNAKLDLEFPSLARGLSRKDAPHHVAPRIGNAPPQWAPSTAAAASQHRHASVHDNLQAAFSDEDLSPSHASHAEATDTVLDAAAASPPMQAPLDSSGSSPPASTPAQPANEFLFYQLADGQRAFLSPLDLRVMAAAHGSLHACPHSLTASIVGMEIVTQTEPIRRRYKHLAHVPLTGIFMLIDVDIARMVPTRFLEPFSKELTARERRREKKAADQAHKLLQEAARDAALAAISSAPSAAELQAMPRLGRSAAVSQEEKDLEAALEQSLAEEQLALLSSSPLPQHGVSFANMARLGFAASGPALSGPSPSQAGGNQASSPPVWGPALGEPVHSNTVQGQWGAARGSNGSLAARLSAAANERHQQSQHLVSADSGQQAGQSSGKKGRKQQMVLLSTGQRKY